MPQRLLDRFGPVNLLLVGLVCNLVAAVLSITAIVWVWQSNRARIDDLCQVIVLAYSQPPSTQAPLELTPEQERILVPVLRQLGANTERQRDRVLRAVDCSDT